MSDENDNIKEGSIPTPYQTFWFNTGMELIKGSSDFLDSAAKTFVTLITTLMTIYAAALTFFGNSTHLSSSPFFFLVSTPLFIFIIAICCLTKVISPKISLIRPDEPDSVMEVVMRRNAEKTKFFNYGRSAFVVALFLMVLCIIFASIGNNLERNAQFIIKEENRPFFENMSISFLDHSTKTVPLTIMDESDTGYQVKTENGTHVFIDKKTIVGVVYPPI